MTKPYKPIVFVLFSLLIILAGYTNKLQNKNKELETEIILLQKTNNGLQTEIDTLTNNKWKLDK